MISVLIRENRNKDLGRVLCHDWGREWSDASISQEMSKTAGNPRS